MHLKLVNTYSRGFTLIEIVIGIIVFSIVLVIITALVAPQAQRSIEPIMQVRATELAQSLLNEITAKSFDENSDRTGGIVRCGETGASSCSTASVLGPDGSEIRNGYDDVDDYDTDGNQLCNEQILNSQGLALSADGRNLYQGFCASIAVFYDDDYNGLNDGGTELSHKLITVTVTTPTNQQLVFSTYRSNY